MPLISSNVELVSYLGGDQPHHLALLLLHALSRFLVCVVAKVSRIIKVGFVAPLSPFLASAYLQISGPIRTSALECLESTVLKIRAHDMLIVFLLVSSLQIRTCSSGSQVYRGTSTPL